MEPTYLSDALLLFIGGVLLIDLLLVARLYIPLAYAINATSSHRKNSKSLISVVIRVHSFDDDLERRLMTIIQQDYPHFEIVFIDDSKNEECGYLLERIRRKYKHVIVTSVPREYRFLSGENLALTIGAKAAKGQWLLFSESKTPPYSNKWISAMEQGMTPETDVVLGFTHFQSNACRIATATLTMRRLLRLAFARWGLFHLADMSNCAIKRDVFLEAHQALGLANLRSDTPLVISHAFTQKHHVRVFMHPDAHVSEYPPKNWSEFFYKRRARRIVQRKYPWTIRAALALESTLRITIWIITIALIIRFSMYRESAILLALAPILIRTIFLTTVAILIQVKLSIQGLVTNLLLADFLSPVLSLFPVASIPRNKISARWR